MSRVTTQAELGNVADPTEFQRFVSQFIQELAPVINGAVEFDKNIASQTLVTYFNAANTDKAITHNLNKTGVNFLTANKTASCDVYHGIGVDTTQLLYLRSTAAGVTVTLVLF